jgi:outer membrane protein assembly factor BamB
VFVGSFDNNYYAIDEESGAFLWSLETGDLADSSPAIVNGMVYVGSYDNRLYAFEHAGSISGTITLTPDYPVSVEVEASQGGELKAKTVITGSGPYVITGLDSDTYSVEAHAPGYEIVPYGPVAAETNTTIEGIDISLNTAWPMFRQDQGNTSNSPDTELNTPLALLWVTSEGVGVLANSPAVADDRIFIQSLSRIFAFDKNSGGFLWSSPVNGGSTPAVAYGKVFFPYQQRIFALNEESGAFVWSYYFPLNAFLPSPTVSNGTVYAGRTDDLLIALNEADGTLKWSYDTNAGQIFWAPAVKDGILYFHSSGGGMDRYIYALRDKADHGELLWTYQGWAVNSPLLVSKERIYFGDPNGFVYAINRISGTAIWSLYTEADFNITSVSLASNGRLFAGQEYNNLVAIEDNGPNATLLWSVYAGPHYVSSSSLANGKVYIGSTNNRIYAFDQETGEKSWEYLANNDVRTGPVISDGRLYFGSLDSKLYAFESAPSGEVTGTITLVPDRYVSVEVIASQSGGVIGSTFVTGSGAYTVSGLPPGTYSLEAYAPGYATDVYGPIEIPAVIPAPSVNANFTLNSAWPMYNQDKEHSGRSHDLSLNPPLQIKWSFYSDKAFYSSPSVLNDRIYIGDDLGRLYAINRNTGLQEWIYSAGGGFSTSSPLIFDDKIYIGSRAPALQGRLHCIEKAGGSLIWSFAITGDGSIESSPVEYAGDIYFGSRDGSVYVVDAHTGAFNWSFTTDRAITKSVPAIQDGVVYIGSSDNSVYAIDSSTGTLRWSYETGYQIEASPAIYRDKVFIGSNDNNLYCLEASDGSFLWQFDTGGDVLSSPALLEDKVFVNSTYGYADAIALDHSGTFLWSANYASYGNGNYTNNSSPVTANGTLYYGINALGIRCYLFGVDVDDGAFKWSYIFTGGLLVIHPINDWSSPAVDDGTLYLGTRLLDDGYLFAFTMMPSITDIKPSSGSVEASVTVTGQNFGFTQGDHELYFGGVSLEPIHITQWNSNQIIFTVTAESIGVKYVSVEAWGYRSNVDTFEVTSLTASPAPSIRSFNPISGLVTTMVSLEGVKFGDDIVPGTFLYFDGIDITQEVTSWSSKEIIFVVTSEATPGVKEVYVEVNSLQSNTILFEVEPPLVPPPPPAITGISPRSGSVEAYVTISGSDFRGSQGSSKVYFGGITLESSYITQWSGDQIIVIASAESPGVKSISVEVLGVRSNIETFEVTSLIPSTLPGIGTFTPAFGSVNTEVTIGGVNFGDNIVPGTFLYFDGTNITLEVTSWTSDTIVFNVPSDAVTGTREVYVEIGGDASNVIIFNVTAVPAVGFSVSNLVISREADSVGSSIVLSWDAPDDQELTIWATTEGYTSFEGWVDIATTSDATSWADPDQVGTGEAQKYYKVMYTGIPQTSIFSAEAVGKVNINILGNGKYTPVSVPFVQLYGDDWGAVIGGQLTSGESLSAADRIMSYIPGAGYLSVEAYDKNLGWTAPVGFGSFDNIIGHGYFVFVARGNPTAEITVVGSVPTFEVSVDIASGAKYTMIGNPHPIQVTLDEAFPLGSGPKSGTPSEADKVALYDGAQGGFGFEYLDGSGWTVLAGDEFTFNPGAAYFYKRTTTEAFTWDYAPPWK